MTIGAIQSSRPGPARMFFAILAAALATTVTARSQETEQAARDGRAVEMRRIADSFSAYRRDGGDRQPIKLRREPLLRWSDTTRQFGDASLWAWGESGRPMALVSLELYPEPGGTDAAKWAYEFISLAPGPLDVRGGGDPQGVVESKSLPSPTGRIHWTPSTPGLTFREFPGAEPPARSSTARLAQMKEILKRVSAVAHPNRIEVLRLMTHPVGRYSDTRAGLIDGAIFAFASGTNPEVLFLIEGQGPSPDKALWRYAVARITAAPYEVMIDKREVASEPYNGGSNSSSGTYFTTNLPRVKPASP